MNPNNKSALLQQLLNAVLVMALIGLLGWLSVRYDLQQDWTVNQRNTLTEASRQQLAAMPEPIRVLAFVEPGAAERAAVESFLEQYRRFKADIQIEFIDPGAQPAKVKEYEISAAGEVVIEYQGRREKLRQLSEPVITGALQRLSFSGESFVVFVEGHGERSTSGRDAADYSAFAALLRDKGLKVQGLNLVQNPSIPDNTAVLVLASPRSALLPGEIELIDQYVKNGGNLLWLADPDHPPGLEALAETLGIRWQNGYAVFPEYQLLGLDHPGVYVALGYPPNPVTTGVDDLTLFPLVRSLSVVPDRGWIAQPMLTSSPEAWLETAALDGSAVTLDEAAGDVPGPLTIGLTLTRDRPAATPAPAEGETAPAAPREQQRIALVGDADFLADSTLGQLANRQLGLNLVQWLAARDSQLNIDLPKAPDTSLFLPLWAQVALGLGFVLVLPLGLLGFGLTRWWLRRRR
ncbi:MAG TPA: GldG family protein [Nevskiaceae bacterium]|nr:GldG family protein [Nevskiaceae bacterium]